VLQPQLRQLTQPCQVHHATISQLQQHRNPQTNKQRRGAVPVADSRAGRSAANSKRAKNRHSSTVLHAVQSVSLGWHGGWQG
jgi:hypothetical protein